MLYQVLREVEQARGPLSLNALSQKLGVEPSALTGMLDFWVRKGRLVLEQDDSTESGACTCPGHSGACSPKSSESGSCTFVARMPRTHTLRVRDR